MSDPRGVPHRKVILVPHDSAWASMYELETARILSACGDQILATEHVGSTSIPGIHAKPIIDIAIAVRELKDADKMQAGMAGLGYDYPRDVGIPNQYVYGKGNPRKYIVHVQEYDSQHWRDYLKFRNALRNDPGLAKRYERLKLELARKYADDRATYTDGKASFVANVVAGS